MLQLLAALRDSLAADRAMRRAMRPPAPWSREAIDAVLESSRQGSAT